MPAGRHLICKDGKYDSWIKTLVGCFFQSLAAPVSENVNPHYNSDVTSVLLTVQSVSCPFAEQRWVRGQVGATHGVGMGMFL